MQISKPRGTRCSVLGGFVHLVALCQSTDDPPGALSRAKWCSGERHTPGGVARVLDLPWMLTKPMVRVLSRLLPRTLLGRTVRGLPIHAEIKAASARAPVALILGGVHGDEPKSVFVARRVVEALVEDPSCGGDVTWHIISVVNPDGYEDRKRRNANRVDLNRNFPTKNWARGKRHSRMFGGDLPASEPETRALIRYIERISPDWIITIHSIGLGRHCNNYDGPGKHLAQSLARHNRYPVTATIGYPTPGSFGTWAGIERGIPMVTLELPSLASARGCWDANRRGILTARA